MPPRSWQTFSPKRVDNTKAYFDKILSFYLWNCPAPNTAYGSKSFKDYGFSTSHEFKQLKNRLLNNEIKFVQASREDFDKTLKKESQNISMKEKEIIIIIKGYSQMDSLFRYIRNAFAHGSFTVRKQTRVDDYFYFLESRNKENAICARIVLKASTLYRWIRFFKVSDQ